MKFKIYLLLFFTGLSSFHANAQTPLENSHFHSDSLKRIVEFLASDSLEGRFSGTPGNKKAALFIANEFKKAGVNPIAGNNGFFQQLEKSGYNIIGAIEGKSKPEQVIIFSAHYDHIGTFSNNPDRRMLYDRFRDKDGDEIFNGANDNASGVAAVISLAKYFKALNNNERTLLFVAFTDEEIGLVGSKHLAKVLKADSIVAMINIEMIGRTRQRNILPYITGSNHSDLKKILNRSYQMSADSTEKELFKPDPYPTASLFRRSDNYPFVVKGVPAHSIMLTAPEDEFYHSLNDEVNTLDYTKMSFVVRAIAYGARSLINGSATPIRIKKIK